MELLKIEIPGYISEWLFENDGCIRFRKFDDHYRIRITIGYGEGSRGIERVFSSQHAIHYHVDKRPSLLSVFIEDMFERLHNVQMSDAPDYEFKIDRKGKE